MLSRRQVIRSASQVAALGLLGITAGCRGTARTPSGYPVVRLDGQPTKLIPAAGDRALVFLFVGVDCPISNRSLPELNRLVRDLAPHGVRFVFIYPNADESTAAIRRHEAEFSLTAEVYRDPEHRLARELGATVTPEAVALSADGRLIYRGRVNDQYAALGQSRPAPTQHDLSDALAGFLAGTPPAGRVQPAVGCSFRAQP
jgi:hypothetical protein